MTEAKNIHEAIINVMNEVGYVQKESSRGLKYSYASETALIQALRPELIANGIYAYVSNYQPERDGYVSTRGTAMTSTLVSGQVTFVHAPSDTQIVVHALGEGADPGDKSANKAMTGMLKYALRQTFLIETGDDPDQERPEQQHGERQGKTKTKPRPADNGKSWPEGADATTAFWARAKDMVSRNVLNQEEAKAIAEECKGNFVEAYDQLTAMEPPDGD